MKKLPAFAILIALSITTSAQTKTQSIFDQLVQKHATASFKELYDLLSLPNEAHVAEDIEKNVVWCEAAFMKRGFTTQRLKTPAAPLLLAQRNVKNPKKTVLIYLQIDGQPVSPREWEQESPWIPDLKEKGEDGKWKSIAYGKLFENYNADWRIFARSTSDAKGPAMAFLASLDALKELKAEPNFNIKVIMDFEEELGSPNLPEAVTNYKNELSADMLIIFDGPRHISNQPTLSFGARGICELT